MSQKTAIPCGGQHFTADFGVFQNVSDDSYKRGYAKGHTDGEQAGYEAGHAQGHTAGLAEGKEIGYETGHTEGYTAGHTAGQKAQYDRFWDAYQNHGNRTRYRRAFAGDAWAAAGLLPPKYPMVLDGSGMTQNEGMFEAFGVYSGNWDTLYDLSETCAMIDFSQLTHAPKLFCDAIAQNITCDFSNLREMNYTFAGSNGGAMDNITLKVTEKLTNYYHAFYCQYRLRNLRFTPGSVIAVSISFKESSGLTADSVSSIVTALQDQPEGTPTLTLHADAAARMYDEDAAVINVKGWTLVY